MLSNKLLLIFSTLLVVVLAITKFSANNQLTEHFGFGTNPSGTWKVDRTVAFGKSAAKKGDFFSVPGTYQAMINPRMFSGSYGANIQYNLPSYKNLGVPCDPLTFGDMAQENSNQPSKENYCGSCTGTAQGCGKGGESMAYHGGAPLMESDYSDGNYNAMVTDAMKEHPAYPSPEDMVPVGDLTTVDSLGNPQQIVQYDRYMYANRNNRLRSLGDQIRGDLPIVPLSTGWFRPSVQPNIDLNQGAMNVLAGPNNESVRALTALMNVSSGGAETAIAGVNVNMASNQYASSLNAGRNDVIVTAFP